MVKSKRTFYLLFLAVLIFSLTHFVFATCNGGSCNNGNPGGNSGGLGIECSDTDSSPEFTNGRNIFVKGLCKDHLDTDGSKLHREDSCDGLAYLNEWYCYQCTEPSCTQILDYPCEYGCVDGHCMAYDEFFKHFNLNIPESEVFCIDGDGPDYPDLPPLTQPNCDDSSNGRNDFSVDSYCVDKSGIYFDKCDGGAIDYYCSDKGFCMGSHDPCKGGCFQGTCNYVPPEEGFCLNPNSDVCTKSFEDLCCPKDDSTYDVDDGPKNHDDCLQNFFIKGDLNGLQKSKCDLVCCCELYYDDENTKQIDAYSEYKISCSGSDQSIYYGNNGCSKESCSNKFSTLPDTIESYQNHWLESIKEGRGCKAGNCAQDLYCLSDLNNNEVKICCKQNDCVNNSLCVPNGTVTFKNRIKYICQNSKWNAEEIDKNKETYGCSFMPYGNSTPLDFGFFTILLFLGFRLISKFFQFIHKDLNSF